MATSGSEEPDLPSSQGAHLLPNVVGTLAGYPVILNNSGGLSSQVPITIGPHGGTVIGGVEYMGGPCGSMRPYLSGPPFGDYVLGNPVGSGVSGDINAPVTLTFQNPLSGMFQSGYGPLPNEVGTLAGYPVVVTSGVALPDPRCRQCGKHLGLGPRVWVAVQAYDSGATYCFECAGYDDTDRQFISRGEELLQTVLGGMPWWAIADWYEDEDKGNDPEKAKWIRENRCGRV